MRSQQISRSGKATPPVPSKAIRRWGGFLASALLLCAFSAPGRAASAGFGPLVKLSRSRVIPAALREARSLGRLAPGTTVQAMIALPWRNASGLETLTQRLTDPRDPLYKKFLTAAQFNAQYAPTQADYDAVKSWALASGLSVDKTTPSRNLLFVRGTRDAVEAAFHVQMNRFQLQTGRVVYTNNVLPSVPQSIAAKISGVTGLDNYGRVEPHLRRPGGLSPLAGAVNPLAAGPSFSATGPGGALNPSNIRYIYNIAPLTQQGLDGAGQTIALFELGAYQTTDIVGYANAFSLGTPNLENVLIDKFSGVSSGAAVEGEVTLDIELALAVAPRAKVIVYEANQDSFLSTPTNVIFDVLNTIANDNRGSVVSISYGQSEEDADFDGKRALENSIFTRMVAQGQCVYASSGDSAAYNPVNGVYEQSVSDPSSQPLVVSVGGTTLLGPGPGAFGTGPAYSGETTWFTVGLPFLPEGAGGGSSKYWFKPAYQAGVGASQTMRDIPDVSLDADPQTGYAIFQDGVFQVDPAFPGAGVGGTSASCPLWAAFNLLVNQQRANFGLGRQGFANPDIYAAAHSAGYNSYFHDIADGSNNGIPAFSAGIGFDDSTGWGSFNAANLITAFAPSPAGLGTLTVHVTDATTGGPAGGAAIYITSGQVPGYRPIIYTDATGTAVVNLPTQVTNFSVTGGAIPIVYTVAVDALNEAGESQGGITPPATVSLTLRGTDHIYPSSSGLQMISAPFDYSTVGDFATLFGLPSPIPMSATGRPFGALFAFSPTLNNYLRYPSVPADTIRLGVGYWALVPADRPYVHRNGFPAAGNQPFRITVQPGWNMIGDPSGIPVPLTSIQVESLPAGATATTALGSSSLVQMPLYTWDGVNLRYVVLGADGVLQPFVGYWIFANKNANLVVPVVPAVPGSGGSGGGGGIGPPPPPLE